MNVPEIVTARIIELMEQGVVPWHRPWFTINPAAYNYVTGKRYSLLNCLLLDRPGGYLTFSQAEKFGGLVKGAKSKIVVFWKPYEENAEGTEGNEGTDAAEPESGSGTEKPKFVLRYYRVFHTSMVRNLVDLPETIIPESGFEADTKADEIIRNFLTLEGIRLEQEPSNKAYYCPSSDTIHMPMAGQFHDKSEYYGTLLHECAHATGAASRLDREGIRDVNFGSDPYAKEELISELTSSILLNTIGLSTEGCMQNTAAYIYGWMQQLKEDPKLIVSACSHASRAANFILDCSQSGDVTGRAVS